MSKKKNEILKVAAGLFAEQGFEKTSMTNICEAADVSKGLVYHHFESKEAILKEIFEQSTERMIEMNKNLKSDTDPNSCLVNLIESLFHHLENDKTFFQLNLNMMFQPSTRKILQKQIKERAEILFDSVKSIFDKFTLADSMIQSYIFIAEIDGIALNYFSSFENYPLNKIKEQLIIKYMSINN